MEQCQCLYHYTSVESLALILSNKTLRFNSLKNVDDLEEVESKDVTNVGRFVVVSCWTNISRDSLPMWDMYTPGMRGVRIKLPIFPFEKYHFGKKPYVSEPLDSYINLEKIYIENKASVVAGLPELVQIEYTDDMDLLKPTILSVHKNTATLNLLPIGKYKRTDWSFQSEWRYKISFAPWSMKEMENIRSVDEQVSLFNRLTCASTPAPYSEFFLTLKKEYLDNIEILLGPKTTAAEYEIVHLLTEKYCENAQIEKSQIKIRS